MKSAAEIKKQNRTALTLVLVAVVLFALLMSLPAFEFTSSVYTKKSANTFVGDEKYQAVRAEVEAVAEEYRADGFDVEISEDVTERTNSKGEKTSMVAFSVSETFTKNGWSFIGLGLANSWILSAAVLLMFMAGACALAGSIQSMDEEYRLLDTRSASFRKAAGVLALLSALLIPVFFMSNTYLLSRKVYLFANDVMTEGKEAYFDRLNAFLYNGEIKEENINAVLKGMKFRCTAALWLCLPCALAASVGAVQLRYGKIKPVLTKAMLYVGIVVLCVVFLYPYYVMLVTAFRSNNESTDMYFQHIFPTKWIWSNLSYIMSRGVPKFLLNSLLIAGGATAIALLCGIPAAYAMARMNFKGKNIFLGFVIMSQMFSPVVLLIGISQLISSMGLNDSIVGLMLINAAFNQAFAIWLLRGTFVSISSEMEQAAKIDGCTTLGSLWYILLPMAAPGIVTTLIFIFINAWNEYTISTVLISTASNKPITVGITQFSSFNMIEWQYLFAASLLATIPVVILFMCIEKHLTAGLTAGGVKG